VPRMRPHQWSFLVIPDPAAAGSRAWTARLLGVCSACGLTRVMEIAGHQDQRFDLAGDCRTPSERAEERRLTQGTGG
jgi:hypothetical protein